MQMSEEGLVKLTQPWEEFVGYPYDDLRAKVRGPDGKHCYAEWSGGRCYGTVTIGFGHTNAAGAPKIVPGMKLTEEEARKILLDDMAPVERMVNRALKANVTQHQYDAIADLTFNCPSALKHVARLVNAGNWPAAERVMLLYVYSKGRRLPGLVRRRAAEIAWANTHDNAELAQAAPKVPKAEKRPSNLATHVAVGGSAIVASGAGLAPHDIVHSHLFASTLGAAAAFISGLVWQNKWKR